MKEAFGSCGINVVVERMVNSSSRMSFANEEAWTIPKTLPSDYNETFDHEEKTSNKDQKHSMNERMINIDLTYKKVIFNTGVCAICSRLRTPH